jgi:membrane-associated phospholipid phosphatase
VTIAFLLVAISVSHHIGVPIRDPEGALLGKRIFAPLVFMGLFILSDATRRARPLWKRNGGRRLLAVRRVLRQRWSWQRVTLALLGFMAFQVTYLAYRNLKSYVMLVYYRTYDQELLDLDRWMSFGNDPAKVLHDVLGTHYAALGLSWIYLAFIPLVAITVAGTLSFVERMRDAYVFVAATIYCWILGTVSYYAIPSLGPFGVSNEFDRLTFTPVTRLQEALIDQRIKVYYDSYGENMVASIGGFASLHVGIVFMWFLMARYYRQRTMSYVVLAFLIPTIFATIYFGWHYLIDDIAGFAIAITSVVGAKWTIYPATIPPVRVIRWLRGRDRSVTAS